MLLASSLLACGRAAPAASPGPASRDLGTQVGEVANDTAVMREANDAANAVIRAAGDCEAVKAALPDASRRLAEAEKALKTATGRTALENLRKQLLQVQGACP
jgi:hypothetical protein